MFVSLYIIYIIYILFELSWTPMWNLFLLLIMTTASAVVSKHLHYLSRLLRRWVCVYNVSATSTQHCASLDWGQYARQTGQTGQKGKD